MPVDLVEVSAPEGYGFDAVTYQTYLVFIDKAPGSLREDKFSFFNDLYFVKNGGHDTTTALASNQTSRLWYVRNADNISEAYGNVTLGSNPGLLRIWDFPMDNTPVTVHKVGYKPTNATTGLTSEDIALGNYGAIPLNGVKMELERNKADDGTGAWKPWDADADNWTNPETKTYSFTTEPDTGNYTFRHGLPMGYYRIKETSLETWAGTYENAYPGTSDRYRYFYVGGGSVTVYMANPEKLSLSIKKTKLDGTTPVSGLQFSLIPVGQTAGTNATTGSDGKASFNHIATGTYYLTETALNSGVSITYGGTSIDYVPIRLTMLESIDWSTIDYITIAYGTNDWNSNYGLDNTENPLDTTTYIGAFRYAVETLLAKFPNIKIIVITPLWRWWDTNTGMPSEIHTDYIDSNDYAKGTGYKLWQYGDALVEAAKWYHIPVFDLYWNCMMFKQNRFEYFNTNDGTHPKAAGLQLMAGMISEQLETRY